MRWRIFIRLKFLKRTMDLDYATLCFSLPEFGSNFHGELTRVMGLRILSPIRRKLFFMLLCSQTFLVPTMISDRSVRRWHFLVNHSCVGGCGKKLEVVEKNLVGRKCPKDIARRNVTRIILIHGLFAPSYDFFCLPGGATIFCHFWKI